MPFVLFSPIKLFERMAHRTASVLFFGSARAKDREGWEEAVAKAEEELAAATDDESRKVLQ